MTICTVYSSGLLYHFLYLLINYLYHSYLSPSQNLVGFPSLMEIHEDEDEQIVIYLREKSQKRLRELDEDEEFLYHLANHCPSYRQPAIYRKRWDSKYLINLANKKKLFCG